MPFISICIPAFNHSEFVRRLLASISDQTFKDFEIIVTDDSTDSSVEIVCRNFQNLPLAYFRNDPPLGTPENWNRAIREASGRWIKIMHHDDWFADSNSLSIFSELAESTSSGFIFCAYTNHHEDGATRKVVHARRQIRQVMRNPLLLLSSNIVGPPSVLMHKKTDIVYDRNLQWLVDIDFYVSVLKELGDSPIFIERPLINIGVHKTQVTQRSHSIKEVEIPEYFYVLNKHGPKMLSNLKVFDAFWRLMRNLDIKSVEDIRDAGYSGKIPTPILRIIALQRRVRKEILRVGPISRILMLALYINVRRRVPNQHDSHLKSHNQ